MTRVRLLVAAATLLLLTACDPVNPPSQPAGNTVPPPASVQFDFVFETEDADGYPIAKTVIITVTSFQADGTVARNALTGEREPYALPPRKTPWIHTVTLDPGVTQAAATVNVRGQAGERLICYAIGKTPGVEMPRTRVEATIIGAPGQMGSAMVICGPVSYGEVV